MSTLFVPNRAEKFSHVPEPYANVGLVNKEEKGFKVDLSVDLIEKINALADDRGMKNKAVASRVLTWFLTQRADVQSVILGQIPADDEFLELVIRRLGDPGPGVVVRSAAQAERPKGGKR